MSGNIWEWCEDIWHEDYKGAPSDGSAWLNGGNSNICVLRGGAWNGINNLCRVSFRFRLKRDIRLINIGFRLSRY